MRIWIRQHAVLARSIVWGVLGAACFVAAISMTWSISHVTTALSANAPDRLERDVSGWYLFAVFAEPGTQGSVGLKYDYTLQDEVAVLSLILPPGGREVVVGADDVACWVDADGVIGEGLRLHDDGGYRQFEVPATIADNGGELLCTLAPRQLRNSFTSFASIFRNDPRGGRKDIEGRVVLPIELTFNSREGAVDIAASGKAKLGDSIILAPGGFVAARFESMHLGEVRDWYILFIGVLVGFGAAMLIETFRPLVDAIGRSQPSAPADAESRP